MCLGVERKFWCVGIEEIRKILTSNTNNVSDVLAILEFDNYDIELTDRGFSDGKRYYDYFCCKKTEGEWYSFDLVDFGDKKPYDFLSDEELKNDMRVQLETFLKKHNI